MAETRFSVGHKGISRVTIYRRNNAPGIYIKWTDDDGRHRRSLKKIVGHPVTDWELAKEIARRLSSAQEKRRNQDAATALGLSVPRTLGELLSRRHEDLSGRWSEKYTKSRKRRKTFWLDALGADAELSTVSPAAVERIAREAQEKRKLSDRWRQDVLRYIVDSFTYAEKKLKWIDARHNLSAVDIPSAKGTSKAYTMAEVRKILPKLWKVDERAGWMGTVAFQTGRRIGAIRRLEAEHVTRKGDLTLIRFPGETDKARKTGEAVVYGLPERTDWSRPSQETVNAWMHDAEALAGVPHVSGRAWHGLKRLYATVTAGMVGADLQSGTLRSTLEGHYRQDTLAPKREVAERLAELVEGG